LFFCDYYGNPAFAQSSGEPNGTRPPNTRYRRSEVSRDVFPQVRDIRPKFPQDYRGPVVIEVLARGFRGP